MLVCICHLCVHCNLSDKAATAPGIISFSLCHTAAAYFKKRPPPSVTVMVGRNASIECIGGGNPPPTVFWTKMGQTGGGPKDAHNGLLTLTNIQKSDEGTYECVVVGERNTVMATTNVKVSTNEGK